MVYTNEQMEKYKAILNNYTKQTVEKIEALYAGIVTMIVSLLIQVIKFVRTVVK